MKYSKERREAISRALKGRKLSPEHIANISKGQRIPKPWVSKALTGKKKTEEHKNNIRKTIMEQQERMRSYEYEYKTKDETPFFGFISSDNYGYEEW